MVWGYSMRQYSKDHLDDLFKVIIEASERGQPTLLLHIKDAFILMEHIIDLEETIDTLEERKNGNINKV